MTDNLDDLKSIWQSIRVDESTLEDVNRRLSDRFSTRRVRTLQERLARRIRIIGYSGLALPLFAPVVYHVLDMPMWLAICYALFGIVMSILSILLAAYINRSELAEMPVADALRMAASIKKWMVIDRIVGIFFGIPILGSMFIEVFHSNEEDLIFGFIAGLGVGLAIGLNRSIKDFRMIRNITECLRDDKA